MAELPSVEQAATATTWFTSQAGISSTILAIVSFLLLGVLVWMVREHKKERAELRVELFGDKSAGIVGIIPDLVARCEKLRVESWNSIDNLMAVQTEGNKELEGRRRQDGIAQFQKLDGILAEVKAMSQGDLEHHHRVEAQVARLDGSHDQMSARLGDMITLATKLAPAPYDGKTERRSGRRRG